MDEFLALPPASILLSSSSFVDFHGRVPGLGFILGQGVSSGCVGGSFSSVTLALLETPAEKIPDLFQPWEILLVPSGSCRAPGHPLPPVTITGGAGFLFPGLVSLRWEFPVPFVLFGTSE